MPDMHLTMTTIDRSRGASVLAFALLAACTDEGSVGVYPESSGNADDGATDESGTSTGSASATDTSADASASSGETDEMDETVGDDSGASSESGGVPACEQSGNCTEYPACETGECGALESLFDENGCLREECQDDDTCADDERCYRAIDFGGCAPSGVFCEDDETTKSCLCGSNPDCGGGFCVPAELYPTASALPQGVVWADATCSPDDGVALYVQWGGFGECDLDERLMELTVFEWSLETGTFSFSGSPEGFGWYLASDETEVEIVTATIDITEFDGAVLSGTVEATLAPNADGISVLAGELVDVAYCGTDPMCG
jgi:hypothetical protein